MELLRLKCPVCHSADIQYHSPSTTKNHGGRVIYKCDTCPVYFSETKKTLMEGLKTPVSVIWQVLKARTEGMGLNAAARRDYSIFTGFWYGSRGAFIVEFSPQHAST